MVAYELSDSIDRAAQLTNLEVPQPLAHSAIITSTAKDILDRLACLGNTFPLVLLPCFRPPQSSPINDPICTCQDCTGEADAIDAFFIHACVCLVGQSAYDSNAALEDREEVETC